MSELRPFLIGTEETPRLIEGVVFSNGMVVGIFPGSDDNGFFYPGPDGWTNFSRRSLGTQAGRYPQHAQRKVTWLATREVPLPESVADQPASGENPAPRSRRGQAASG